MALQRGESVSVVSWREMNSCLCLSIRHDWLIFAFAERLKARRPYHYCSAQDAILHGSGGRVNALNKNFSCTLQMQQLQNVTPQVSRHVSNNMHVTLNRLLRPQGQ